MSVIRLTIGAACPHPEAYPAAPAVHARQFHSFINIGANPLQTTWTEHGMVSGREAFLLRSAEIQPLLPRFSD